MAFTAGPYKTEIHSRPNGIPLILQAEVGSVYGGGAYLSFSLIEGSVGLWRRGRFIQPPERRIARQDFYSHDLLKGKEWAEATFIEQIAKGNVTPHGIVELLDILFWRLVVTGNHSEWLFDSVPKSHWLHNARKEWQKSQVVPTPEDTSG